MVLELENLPRTNSCRQAILMLDIFAPLEARSFVISNSSLIQNRSLVLIYRTSSFNLMHTTALEGIWLGFKAETKGRLRQSVNVRVWRVFMRRRVW